MSTQNSEPKPILTIADWLDKVSQLETSFNHPDLWPELPPTRCLNCDRAYDCWVDPEKCWRKQP